MTTPKKPKKATPERKPRARREPTVRVVDLAKATNLALAGATYKQIASELEVDEETVRYHLLSPEGQRALRYAVNDLQDRTDRFLASAHLQAIRRLVREMEEAEKPGDRIRAAQAITMLAAKRIEITGANGAPIEVDTSVASLLDERISRMRERSRSVIETTGGTVLAIAEAVVEDDNRTTISELHDDGPQPTQANDANDNHVSGPEALVPTEPAVRVAPATRNRQPAGLRPGQGIRAIR